MGPWLQTSLGCESFFHPGSFKQNWGWSKTPDPNSIMSFHPGLLNSGFLILFAKVQLRWLWAMLPWRQKKKLLWKFISGRSSSLEACAKSNKILPLLPLAFDSLVSRYLRINIYVYCISVAILLRMNASLLGHICARRQQLRGQKSQEAVNFLHRGIAIPQRCSGTIDGMILATPLVPWQNSTGHKAQSSVPIGGYSRFLSIMFFSPSCAYAYQQVYPDKSMKFGVCVPKSSSPLPQLHPFRLCSFFASTSDPSVTLEVSICQAVRHSDKSSSGSGFLGLVASRLSPPSSPHQARCPDGERRRQLGSGIRFAVLYRNAEEHVSYLYKEIYISYIYSYDSYIHTSKHTSNEKLFISC